ncbi:MAG TPA: DUF885 domain-containing protein [Prolixibacteraceae bacterium]|nr:DUF885 domain-containing protein [Prolixibacteraceae bacterium]
MKKALFFLAIIVLASSCKPGKINPAKEVNKELASLLDKYYNDRMQLYPLKATINGDNRFNNLLPADFTDSYREKLIGFFNNYQISLSAFDSEQLNENDKISFDILKWDIDMGTEGLVNHYVGSSDLYDNTNIPFNQVQGVPLLLGQMGGSTGSQPFKIPADYDNWLQRATAFSSWADSAIVYFKKGIAVNNVLPKAAVVKMIPQMLAMVTDSAAKSLFYEPVKLMPSNFSESDKKRLTNEYINLINQQIVPSYKKLTVFLKTEYLPNARNTTGVNALPDGDKYYSYMVKYWTTTDKTPDEIYKVGISEVKRIRDKMELIKSSVQFKGDLKAFFEFMKTDKQFMPYKSAGEVLDAFRSIQTRMDPNLKKMYNKAPKTKFEIRQTEAFRAASANAQYYAGLADGSRPGIFYVPIVDATKFNVTSGMESLFLHEAIPGHHYQISLQREKYHLPKFRRFIWYGAYGEGYALYCESLGKELGLYTDPWQQMGNLRQEIHRAIRLVVDVAMHTGKMTREEAIKYSLDNEPITEDGATAEIERYMVQPGQALSYKIGELKIRELRDKYMKELGNRFSLADFHDELLKDGCLPLNVLEKKMDDWAKKLH